MIEDEPLIIDGWTVPMHSDYKMDWRKISLEKDERTVAGNMVFSKKTLAPYLSVTWNFILIEDYIKIQSFFKKDECTVQFLNLFTNQYETGKFTIQQPKFNKINAKHLPSDGIIGLQLEFEGTLN